MQEWTIQVRKRKKNRRKNQNNIRDNGKTFIFTIEKDFIQEAKDFFESPDFYGIVSDTTLIGRSLYVDLHGSRLKEKFFNKINERVDDLTALGIEDFKGCSVESCASLNVNGINLVPMLDKSFHFKFDTFLLCIFNIVAKLSLLSIFDRFALGGGEGEG